MQRRKFFKSIVASSVGLFAVSNKPTKAQEQPQTTLRFNEDKIEAWNGEKWLPAIVVKLPNEAWEDITNLEVEAIDPTAEQKSAFDFNHRSGEFKE